MTDIDWQSPEVLSKLTADLIGEIHRWQIEFRDGGRPDDPGDITAAIRFAGEKLDAFQMARFLEDSRGWPSNQQLVYVLRNASQIREGIISALRKEAQANDAALHGKTQYAPGFQFCDSSGRVWVIKQALSPEEFKIYERADPSSQITASREAIGRCLAEYDQGAAAN